MICGYKAVFVFSSHFIWWGVCRLYFSHVTCTHKRSKAKKMKKLQPSQFMLPYNRIYLQMRHAMNKQMFRFVSLRFSWIYVLYTIAWLWNDNTTMKEQKRKKSPMTSSQAPVRLFVCLFCRIFYKSRLDVIYPNNLLLSPCVFVLSAYFVVAFNFVFIVALPMFFRIFPMMIETRMWIVSTPYNSIWYVLLRVGNMNLE